MALLDTLIFLTAVYLTLSTVVSYLNEQLAATFHWRGQQLYQGVLNLVCGEAPLVQALFKHPLVAASQNDKDGIIKSDETYRPSYIAARNFTLAFHDLISNATVNPQGQRIYSAGQSAITAPDKMLAALQAQAAAWQGTQLGAQLNALLIQAQGNYDKLLLATDAWFNRQMDRVSGWYKRFTQPILFAIGALVTWLLGVDTVRIVGCLQTDPGTRSSLVQGIVNSQTHLVSDDVISKYAAVFVPGFTAGWGAHQWPTHVAGLIITTIAASLGAPFWFDLLSCIMNVRLAGQRPPTTDPTSKAAG